MEELYRKSVEWFVANAPVFATKILVVLVVLFFGNLIINGASRVLGLALDKSKRITPLLRTFILGTTVKLLWLLLVLVVLGQLGVEIGPIVAGLGVTGFILGFAFQDSLSNLAAGFMILLNMPFEVGHYVEVAGFAGSVQEMNLMATTLVTPDNKKIMIPNKSVWGTPIVNYSSTGTRRVDMTVGIAYASDIAKAKSVLVSVLKSEERLLSEPAPVVELMTMADSSLLFVVRPWVNTADYWDVYFSLNQRIKEALDREGIEIPFPQRVVHMVDAR